MRRVRQLPAARSGVRALPSRGQARCATPLKPGAWRGRFLLTGLWVAGLAAAQLLPFLDLLAHSQRDKAFGDSLWSMPVWGWANFLVPLYRTYQTPLGLYAQPDQYWVSSYYLGVGVLALALLAVGQVRRPRVCCCWAR